MRFFNTRIVSGIIDGRYFITSEVNPSDQLRFSVRSFDAQGNIDTVGEFHSHDTKAAALKALKLHVAAEPVAAG